MSGKIRDNISYISQMEPAERADHLKKYHLLTDRDKQDQYMKTVTRAISKLFGIRQSIICPDCKDQMLRVHRKKWHQLLSKICPLFHYKCGNCNTYHLVDQAYKEKDEIIHSRLKEVINSLEKVSKKLNQTVADPLKAI